VIRRFPQRGDSCLQLVEPAGKSALDLTGGEEQANTGVEAHPLGRSALGQRSILRLGKCEAVCREP
jgi:hypothetical protein